MDERLVAQAAAVVDWSTGKLSGGEVCESRKTIGDLRGIFASERDWRKMDPNRVVYHVQWVNQKSVEAEGGLLWGNTTVEAGLVGDEYFMTHGHFHSKPEAGEFYATISGVGLLVLMDSLRQTKVEKMLPGTLHYISAGLAHRVVNIGDQPLRFVACWPSDAGHDYTSIARDGFSLRVLRRNDSWKILPCGR